MTADVEKAIQQAQRCQDASTRAYVLQLAGAALLHGRSIHGGYHLFRQSVEVCEANDLAFHLSAAHGGALAWLPWSGRLDQIRRHARRAIELSRRLGRPGWEAVGLTGMAACDVLRGDHARAQSRLSQAQTALRPRGLEGTHYAMWLRHWQSLSAYASGDLEAARSAAEGIVRIARGGGSRLDEAIGEWLLGLVTQGQKHDDAVRKRFEASRELSTYPRLPHTLGRSLLGLAELARQDEGFEEAWELAHDSLEVLDEYGDRVGAAAALDTTADLAVWPLRIFIINSRSKCGYRRQIVNHVRYLDVDVEGRWALREIFDQAAQCLNVIESGGTQPAGGGNVHRVNSARVDSEVPALGVKVLQHLYPTHAVSSFAREGSGEEDGPRIPRTGGCEGVELAVVAV